MTYSVYLKFEDYDICCPDKYTTGISGSRAAKFREIFLKIAVFREMKTQKMYFRDVLVKVVALIFYTGLTFSHQNQASN